MKTTSSSSVASTAAPFICTDPALTVGCTLQIYQDRILAIKGKTPKNMDNSTRSPVSRRPFSSPTPTPLLQGLIPEFSTSVQSRHRDMDGCKWHSIYAIHIFYNYTQAPRLQWHGATRNHHALSVEAKVTKLTFLNRRSRRSSRPTP
jgi:hypothetical protein